MDVAHHGVMSRRFSFYHLLDDACAKGIGFTKKPQLMMRRDHITKEPSFYDGDWNPMQIMEWMWASVTPSSFEFTQENYELIYYQNKP